MHVVKYGQIPLVEKAVSRLVMGSVTFGQGDSAHVDALLDRFVALGGNAIDTAHSYGRGAAERAVGAWMARRGNREAIVLIGKGAHYDASGQRVNPAAITSDLLDSLDRLQTSSIDLYLLHRDDPTRPVGEIVECLNEHYRAGRIRAFGGSNWTVERIDAANEYAHAHGLVPFVASSPNLSLAVMNEPAWPGCIALGPADVEWYTQHQFPLLSWSSQAQGFFTGRFSPDDRSNAEMVRVWYSADNFARLERARQLGERMGVSANSVALAYVLCQPFPTFALIGPRTVDELNSSATAIDVTLTPQDVEWLGMGRL